jgi:protein TonB
LAIVLALHLLAWQGLRGLGLPVPQWRAEEPVMTAIVTPAAEPAARPTPVVPSPVVARASIEPPRVEISVPAEVVSITLPEPVQVAAPSELPTAVIASPPRPAGTLRVDIAEIDYLRAPTPRYPPAARRLRLQGVVQLLVAVDVQGRVSGAVVQSSSGHAELDSAARQAVFDARFRPYQVDGEPRAVEVLVPVQFALSLQRASRPSLEAHAPNA